MLREMSRAEDLRPAPSATWSARRPFRREHRSVDAVYAMADRDIEIGGGIMAGALAYRIFVWLLPFALVLVGGIGIAADVSSESPASAARSLGLQGVVSNSVAQASQGIVALVRAPDRHPDPASGPRAACSKP